MANPFFFSLLFTQGFLWGSTTVSLCFLSFRLFVRIRYFKKLYSDDWLVILAWTLLLANAILWQTQAPALYELFDVVTGKKPSTPGYIDRQQFFVRALAPLTIMFYSCLWIVKLSLLLFFHRLGSKFKGHKLWWWCILVVVVATWVSCLAITPYECFFSSFEHIAGQLTYSHRRLELTL